MGVSSLRFIFRFAFCCTIFETVLAWQTVPANRIYRIYVEPFATQAGSEEFREDVIAELRKLNLVSLTVDESSADANIGGGGKIWIKGYRSPNPQLGDPPRNCSPVYTSSLSIEFRVLEQKMRRWELSGDLCGCDVVVAVFGMH